jgi:hypothetical protein
VSISFGLCLRWWNNLSLAAAEAEGIAPELMTSDLIANR